MKYIIQVNHKIYIIWAYQQTHSVINHQAKTGIQQTIKYNISADN